MPTDNFSRGSEWRKCDLHIHTPFSAETTYGNKSDKTTWDSFIADIEANYDKGSIIGINDYNTFDGYFKILSDYPDFVNKYKLFPVIELRTDDYVGKTSNQKINLHIILSDTIKQSELNSILDTPLTRDRKKIKDISNFANEPICMEKLYNFLIENSRYYKDKYLLMLGRNEAGEIDNEIQGVYMQEAHFICSASETIEQAKTAYANTHKYYGTYDIKYLHCSDAHRNSTEASEQTRKIGHCFTWIKGKPCFETLRQAFFSYDTRIRISEKIPTQAVNVLDKVKINLPADSKIGDNDCCFAGKLIELNLNPALNCFIGGRGTGKSLLLQLFCKNNLNLLPKNDESIVSKIKPTNWPDSVEIDGIEFEYFCQGKIADLYKQKDDFKKSVSDRLYKFWETEEYAPEPTMLPVPFIDDINNKKTTLQESVKIINAELLLLKRKVENDNKIKVLEREIATRKKIVETYKDEEYKRLSELITVISKKASFIRESKQSLESLTNKIADICMWLEKITIDGQNSENAFYANKYNALLDLLKSLIQPDVSEEKKAWDTKKSEIYAQLKIAEDNLKTYFDARGMSKANIEDAARAQKELDEFNGQIKKLTDDNNRAEQDVVTLKTAIDSANTAYKIAMTGVLKRTENELKKRGNDEISRLTFQYKYDTSAMFGDIAKFFKDNSGVNEGHFKSIWQRSNDAQKQQGMNSDILEQVCRDSQEDLDSSRKILEYFSINPRHKKIYDLNYLLCRYNGAAYELFDIMYRGNNNTTPKTLEDLSFGQRATAIVLTLLLLNNKPLIIDEPETHLDQRLIADELVNVIKQVKMDKQIIFATHNANIVINGDAEQIYILKTESDNKTSFTQMSIEDVYEQDKQKELLMLEGSVEAFQKRKNIHYNS